MYEDEKQEASHMERLAREQWHKQDFLILLRDTESR